MKNANKRTKQEFKYFTIMDFAKEAEYLQKQRKAGWKLTAIKGFGMYHFEECEPEDVVYQLDYNKEGLKNKEEYIQMFRDCGWEYLMDYVGYSYFCKPRAEMADGEEEIFCDDESRLEMVGRIFRGRILSLILLFAVMVFTEIADTDGPVRPLVTFMLVLYTVAFALFGYRYYELKKRMKR